MLFERADLFQAGSPLRKQVRSREWFTASVQVVSARILQPYELRPVVDEDRVARAFADWMRCFDLNRHLARSVRRQFILYMGGVVSRELVRSEAIGVSGEHHAIQDVELSRIVEFWPEGYCALRFCAEICSAILEDEQLPASSFVEARQSLTTWWSMRENAAEYAGWVVPFFQRVMAESPDWDRVDAPPRSNSAH
ncbi:hypothetical protein GCM10007036_16850 [Alsobacter metallidurans]|uniref:Uncharacterized protein n=1 Tax=Alsobacter metallidurans TaxID=340221 RepID=A0A917MH89_9HYPH|nr:hypothetical protein [Alsobacter metallidurans]GGH16278.1 hypothetical protein GCM10007036_16850 [Alsobacter metallidurans]